LLIICFHVVTLGSLSEGLLLENGTGVAKDPDAAMALYNQAAANGYKLAAERIGT
jgi:TPR repeat protein